MPHDAQDEMTFELELHLLLAKARADRTPFEQLERAVAGLHRKYDREVPPPITGTMAVTDPEDKFGA